MHVKLATCGGRQYLQLVASFRDDAGRVRKRAVATLGRADKLAGGLDSVINGLLKASGRGAAEAAAPDVAFESARALSDVWALTELWKQPGFDRLRRVFRKTRHATDVEALVRVMGSAAVFVPPTCSALKPLSYAA